MKRIFTFVLLCITAQLIWAQTVVSTDAEIRAAIQNDGVTIRVDADIDLSNSTLSMPSNHSVTIDLNGHKLDRKLTKRGEGGGQVITVRQGATLNLSNGTLAGGWGGAGGGLVNEGGTVELTDVTVTNNVADDRGGGICNRNGGVLTMTNCTITDNHSNDHSGAKGGGGFFNEENATATLTNVSITGNEAKVCGGGGICNFGTLTMTGGAVANNISQDKTAPEGGGGIFNAQNGTATLTNVTITGNKAEVKGGGGICNYGTMTIDGCAVIDNTCQLNGGGIWTAANATLNMKGANTVTGNKSAARSGGVNNDLFLKTNALVTVTGSLAGSTIGIDMESLSGIFTSGYNTHNSGVDPATIFQTMLPDVMAITLDGDEANLGSSLPEGDYYYIDHQWMGDHMTYEVKILHPGEYTLLSDGYHEDTDMFLAGTYVVKTAPGSKCHYNGIAYASEDTKIILCDGSKLELDGNLVVTKHNKTLDIYGQACNSGILQTHGDISHSGAFLPGIGAVDYKYAILNFHGGNIQAQAENRAAGIGALGVHNNDTSRICFYDAFVDAHGGEDYGSGIGTSSVDIYVYDIYIYGGKIKAHGGDEAAGIGGGANTKGLNVYVYGGDVSAWGGDDGAGIGSGATRSGGNLTVYGGIVRAWGGGNGAGIGSGSEDILTPIKTAGYCGVFGGEVYAYGGVDAAGIGGGEDVDGGVVEIGGGYVYAQGGDYGAGIGGGQSSSAGSVTITGGTVVARAGRDETGCRAIGPGAGCDDYGSLTLGDDLMVTSERRFTAPERKNACWYRTQVRIEPCDHSEVTYTVDGYTAHDHHIAHCVYCNHTDTALHTFNEHGVCTVCGVQTTAYAAKLYMPVAQPTGSFDGQTYSLTATHLVVPDSTFRLPMATLKVPGYQFIGWEATTAPTEDTYVSPYTTATEKLYNVGAKYAVTGNICFVARYKVADITLYDNEPNGEVLNEFNGMKVSKVTLAGRVLNKNNTWQPLALPFSLNTEQLAASPLAGCTLLQLDTEGYYDASNIRYTEPGEGRHQTGIDSETGMVYLYFLNAAEIEAGKPYLIRWTNGNPVLSPEFVDVTLTNSTADSRGKLLQFKSIYSPQTFASANKMVLYVTDRGTLVHPDGTEPVTVGACRAYFRLTNFQGGDGIVAATILSNIDLPMGVEEVESQKSKVESHKVIRDGMLLVERNGKIYNAQGQIIK